MKMIARRPSPLKPRRDDDHNVRVYRHFLLALIAAGDDESRRDAISLEFPHVANAHSLHYSSDILNRQILDARLLTEESSTEIANRFSTDPKAIDYYEQIFFNVRDRLQNVDWIRKVILGPPAARVVRKDGMLTDAERGLVYRTFAYFGGPLALDVVISGIAPQRMPMKGEDIAVWFGEALSQIVQSRAGAAALTLTGKQTGMQLVKLGVRALAARAKRRDGS